jgi:tetratricopeptide (TPR) repeat protein
MLGRYYKFIGNIDETIKWWNKSKDLGNGDAALKLGEYYKSIDNIDEMLKCYIKGIEIGDRNCFEEFVNYYDSKNSKIDETDVYLETITNVKLQPPQMYDDSDDIDEYIYYGHKYDYDDDFDDDGDDGGDDD